MNDSDYSSRWKVIKARFSCFYLLAGGSSGSMSSSNVKKGELGVWQRCFWEQRIRDVGALHWPLLI